MFIYALWRVMKDPGQIVGLVQKKSDDGARHIEERLKQVMWWHLPPWLKALYTVAPIKGTFNLTHATVRGRLEPWGSYMTAYPKGAEQLRSFVHSLLIGDEVCFQPDHEAWWTAAVPTIQARGRHRGQVIQMSSAAPDSFFEKQCADKNPARLRRAVRLARESGLAAA